MSTISISENDVWAGNGTLRNGVIENCPAVLGADQDMADRAYDAIADAIARGETSVTMGDYRWTWEIFDAE